MLLVKIGQVHLECDLVMQPREIRSLVRFLASIAVAMGEEPEPEEEPKPGVSLGFTTEIAPVIEPDLSEYFEEERNEHYRNP